mgnify:CR=1 FL=1
MNTSDAFKQTQWLTLFEWTLLSISGRQAWDFLQGQVTCDLYQLEPGTSLLGAHCTPKGRVVFSFRILALDEQQLVLRLPLGMVESARLTLGKYIRFSKAELTDDPAQRQARGLVGPQARKWLGQHLIEPAREPGEWVSQDGQIILTVGQQCFECWLSPDRAERLDAEFGRASAPEGDNLWRLLDIEAGVGEVRPQTREAYTPQALNLPELDGVSFRKGCYTGQEVVARLHYKGKTKRRMQHLRVQDWRAQALPQPGELLLDTQGKVLGEVLLSARTDSDALHLLAVIGTALDERHEAGIAGHTHAVQTVPLPYNTAL